MTTGQILAMAAFYDDKYSQAFPHFGVERAGAPVTAFVRIDDKRIDLRSHVYEPDMAIVLDASLIKAVDVTAGLKTGGIIIVNSDKSPKELGIKGSFDVHVIDATAVAMEVFGKPIVNTAMLGAFAAITKLVSLKSLKRAIDEKFTRAKGGKLTELNHKAIESVYQKSSS